MKKTCDDCRHGTRHNAVDGGGRAIPKDWRKPSEAVDKVDTERFWTYLVCAKNTFSITTPCGKFQK